MNKIEIEFKNYKLLKDKKITLEGSNIYLVQGGNEKGKTSFCNGLRTLLKAESKTPNPVTIGEKDGTIVGTIELADKQSYVVKFDFSNEDKDKFTLIKPDGSISKKVTEIRELFQFTDFTAEEFLSWGKTAEGKRKQRSIILGLLPIDVQQAFAKKELEEKTTYDLRTSTNSKREAATALLSNKIELTEQEVKLIPQIDALKAKLQELRTELVSISESISHNRSVDAVVQQIINLRADALYLINKSESVAVTQVSTVNDCLDLLDKAIFKCRKKVKSKEEIQTRIDKGESLIRGLEQKQMQVASQKEQQDKLLIIQTECDRLNDLLNKIRKDKQDLITKSKLPLEEVTLGNDGIYLKIDDQELPFDAEQVSTSRVMKLVAKIMLLINKKTPILLMGRAESFDNNSLNELNAFAEENNCVMIMDRVIEEAKELQVIGYEPKQVK